MKRIAVIGGGIAGLTAAYYLSRKHQVTLFERTGRIGGNAYTYRTRTGEQLDIAVAAFGRYGYRRFFRLLDELGIETERPPTSYMSFHDLEARDGHYVPTTLRTLFAQAPSALRTAREGLRLYMGLRRVFALYEAGEVEGLTVRALLERIPELSGAAETLLLCTLSLISSMSCEEVLDAPAAFFCSKLTTHPDLLSPRALYSIRCVKNGTAAYVDALAHRFRDRIVLDAQIRSIARSGAGVTLRLDGGARSDFDAVVLACPPDQALALMEQPTDMERALLGAWRYKDGRVAVHRDWSSFPARDLIQAYTFLYRRRDGQLETSVNGALWHEPQATEDCDYISSQHPNFPIREDLTELDTVLRTPIFDHRSCATQAQLPRLNHVGGTYYCGSYFGHGLHEDAVSSAVEILKYFDLAA